MTKKPLKIIIDKLLRAYGYQEQLDEIELIKQYEDLVGKMFANHTKKIYFKSKTLHVFLDSAPLKQELSYMKETLILKLNQNFSRNMINNIIIK